MDRMWNQIKTSKPRLIAFCVAAFLLLTACGTGVGYGVARWMISSNNVPQFMQDLAGVGKVRWDVKATPEQLAKLGADEKTVEAYQASDMRLDADGDYEEAIEGLASKIGVKVHWGLEGQSCQSLDLEDTELAIMEYCGLDPDDVWVNVDHADWEEVKSDPVILTYFKHELAHRSVNYRTGSTAPVIGGNSEALANSYALKYLGASQLDIVLQGASMPKYDTTPETDYQAVEIHDHENGETHEQRMTRLLDAAQRSPEDYWKEYSK